MANQFACERGDAQTAALICTATHQGEREDCESRVCIGLQTALKDSPSRGWEVRQEEKEKRASMTSDCITHHRETQSIRGGNSFRHSISHLSVAYLPNGVEGNQVDGE